MTEAALDFSEEDIQKMLDNIDSFSPDEVVEIDRIVDELASRKQNELAYNDLIEFCKRMQPDYIVGKHHRILSKMLMDIEQGNKDRICVNIPPRHGKSQLVSIYFPAWFLGRNPNKKVMMVSHTTDLAVDFGRKVRNLIATDEYKSIFPTVALSIDSKSAGRWNTNVGGEYYACGIGSSIAGRGADLLLVDDPHSEQDVINGNFEVFEKAYEWFTFGARTRLMPGGRVAIIQTRWHMDDLTGRVTRDMVNNDRSDQYEVVEFPAIIDTADKKNKPIQKPLWPEFFDLDALLRTKASMPTFQWNAQYQQNPTSAEGSIIKREWWKKWPHDKLPALKHVIQSYDTAFMKKETADFSAISTWGVFELEDGGPRIILLDVVKDRYEFPELRKKAKEQYDYWKPESVIVEAKASGLPLTYELRKMGIPVINFTPSKGNDKHTRVNSVAPLFESGMVWYPDRKFTDEMIEECAAFPLGEHDDLVDSMTQAVMRFRQGGFVEHPDDYEDEPLPYEQRTYY